MTVGVAKAVRLTSFVYFRLEATLHAGDMIFQTGVIYRLKALAKCRTRISRVWLCPACERTS